MIYLNCLAKDIANAKDIMAATNNHAIIAVQTKNYATVEAAVKGMTEWGTSLNHFISISLGNADPKQSHFVRDVAKEVFSMHANQTFPLVGQTMALAKNPHMITNALVHPTGQVDLVNITSGPLSSALKTPGLVSAEAAVVLAKEMGAKAIKLFSMTQLKSDAEFIAVAKACAKHDMILEMTGGLSIANIEPWVRLAKAAGVKTLIPHVYSAIVDAKTGLTNIDDVKALWALFTKYYRA